MYIEDLLYIIKDIPRAYKFYATYSQQLLTFIMYNLQSDYNNEVVSWGQVWIWGVTINLVVHVVFAKRQSCTEVVSVTIHVHQDLTVFHFHFPFLLSSISTVSNYLYCLPLEQNTKYGNVITKTPVQHWSLLKKSLSLYVVMRYVVTINIKTTVCIDICLAIIPSVYYGKELISFNNL